MTGRILVLGLGNTLLTDDGIGLHVIAALEQDVAKASAGPVVILDGGTLGLSLLPEIEAATALIVVDAANFGGAPGEVRVFDEAAMDAQLGAAKTSAHELALADLISAARLCGSRRNGGRSSASRLRPSNGVSSRRAKLPRAFRWSASTRSTTSLPSA